MTLEQISPRAEDLHETLRMFRLLPDAWLEHPELLAQKMPQSIFWALKAGRRQLGLVWLSDIYPGEEAHLHIVVDKKYRRFMRPSTLSMRTREEHQSWEKLRMLNYILSYCFDELGVRRVVATIPSSRRPACRMVRRLSFVREGRLRRAVKINGQIDDLEVWAFTDDQYTNWRKEMLGGENNHVASSSSY